MCTLSCRNKHIRAIQCLQSKLGSTINTALTTGRGDINCLIKRNNIIRSYLRILYCHWAPGVDPVLQSVIDIPGNVPTSDFRIQATLDGSNTDYNYFYFGPPLVQTRKEIFADITSAFSGLSDIDTVELETKLYVLSSNPTFSLSLLEYVGTDVTVDDEDDLTILSTAKNCLTCEQIQNIITSAYKILDADYGCGCS